MIIPPDVVFKIGSFPGATEDSGEISSGSVMYAGLTTTYLTEIHRLVAPESCREIASKCPVLR